MYSSIWVHHIQTLWIITVIFGVIIFVRLCDWSLWLSVPMAVIVFFIVGWIGIALISMLDYNHRMAAKYSVKIENLPLYFALFEKLTELEAQGIDSSGIPSEVKDTEDWLRFCRWQAIEMNTDKDGISVISRLLLAIPFIRHWKTKNTFRDLEKENKLLDVVNRSYGYMTAPNIVKLYNTGKVDQDAMCSPAYHKYCIAQLFGNKAKDISENITVERARLKSNIDYTIYLVHIPSIKEIGQNDIVAFVVNPANKAYFYTWEWSVNQTHMICSFEDKSHLNFGVCNDKIEFVKRIVELSND